MTTKFINVYGINIIKDDTHLVKYILHNKFVWSEWSVITLFMAFVCFKQYIQNIGNIVYGTCENGYWLEMKKFVLC